MEDSTPTAERLEGRPVRMIQDFPPQQDRTAKERQVHQTNKTLRRAEGGLVGQRHVPEPQENKKGDGGRPRGPRASHRRRATAFRSSLWQSEGDQGRRYQNENHVLSHARGK